MTSTTELDQIVRDITIGASQERVFALASTPGWWINDGEIIDHRIDADDQGRSVVHDPVHGDFVLETVDRRPPSYVSFRWFSGAEMSTLVEFFVERVDEGSSRLRVCESGFASLDVDAQERRRRLDDNTEGWRLETAALQRKLEAEGA